MIKTKIAAWLVIGISLIELYLLGKALYEIILIRAYFSDYVNPAQYLPVILYYLIPIILSIFILFRKKWAWWILIAYLAYLMIFSLIYIIAYRTKIILFLHIANFITHNQLIHHGFITNWEYLVCSIAFIILGLLFVDRRNFFKN
jgi:hypothetical protein